MSALSPIFPVPLTELHGVTTFLTASNWLPFIIPHHDTPFHYLEIGVHCGINLLSVIQLYGRHPLSTFEACDPWQNYKDYNEYQDTQNINYENFLYNILTSKVASRVTIHRDLSGDVLPRLQNQCYDVIYVDGNHSPDYVLEDAVKAFPKLKIGGHLIFDDYGFQLPEKRGPQEAIDAFLRCFAHRIKLKGADKGQIFIERLV